MSKLTILSLLIADYVNERANKFVFSDSANLIVSSTNGEGKSSLVKSIYYALGANLKSFPKHWEADDYIFQLEVCIDGKRVLIKRHNKVISILENDEVKIFENFKDYTTWFQNQLGMNLELVSKNSNSSNLASIEAIFSPMYIDQDKSWDGKLFKDSFEGLGRYNSNNFPKNIFDYYLGIADSDIINKEAEKNDFLHKLEMVNVKISQVKSVYETYRSNMNVTESIPKNFIEYKKELDFYIKETNQFSKEISEKTEELSKEKVKLDILRQELDELKKLASKTKKRFSEIKHECVYCHSVLTREQSLTRLELEDNDLAISIRIDIISQKIMKSEGLVKERSESIEKLQEEFKQYNKRVSELKQLSNIEEYINQNVLLELKKLEIQENDEKTKLDSLIIDITNEIRNLKKELSQRAKKIESEYEVLKNEISRLIGSSGIADRKFRNFNKLQGSGTNLNKDLLTVFLTYMNLIDRKSAISLPFAIDSFVKNETDVKVLEKMFNAINKNYLTLKSQTFFSIIEENLKYIHADFHQVRIESPLLESDSYLVLSKEII
ncbi:TPA: endonuclease [Streptococcus suis]